MSDSDPSNLAVDLAGLRLRNPVLLSAGTCGYVDEMADVLDLSKIGAVITKSITAEPREGNPPQRITGTARGMLNAIGLANCGLDRFMAERLPRVPRCRATVIGSIAGHSIQEYVKVAQAFDASEHLAAVELNVSCPNTGDGLVFGEDPTALKTLLHEVRPALRKTKMIVKLSPNVPSITAMAQAAVAGGADILSLVNTFKGLAIDVETKKSKISRGIAGYSGPGIHPIALRLVHMVYRNVAKQANIPIIAYGGVMYWEDAAEFILAGASAVGMGTALFVDPQLALGVVNGLEKWTRRQGVGSIRNLVGQIVI